MLIRPIRADDKAMLSDGLRHLSDQSVQRRFLTGQHVAFERHMPAVHANVHGSRV